MIAETGRSVNRWRAVGNRQQAMIKDERAIYHIAATPLSMLKA